MRRRRPPAGLAPLLIALIAPLAVAARAGDAREGDAIRLYNGKDLAGWSIFIRHKDGSDPRSDPKGVFRVEDGILHVSGEEFGCLTTRDEFQDYHLVVEFKWGEKRWPPRENAKRDSGILVHCVGPEKVWPRSIECQIQEHDCGDFYLVDGTTIDVDGQKVTRYKQKTKDLEKPNGEWNTVEVICEGDAITNIVNGEVVNKGTGASVRRGRILLQSEGAEIFFRKVELRPLTSK